ncbi:MAG: OmpH family outer membrane protein [Panacagrimonas sp.]
MRKPRCFSFRLLFAALLLSVSGLAAAEITIVSIRAAEIVQASPQFKSGQAQIKTEFEKRKADLESEAKKLAEDVKKFQREADVMSGDARAKMEKDLQTRKIDFDYKQRQFGEDFKKRDRELTETLMARIRTVVEAVAKERGADLVLQDPVYAAESIDVTAEVVKRLQDDK